jgi:membrane protein involved in colicin uptake
VDPQTAEKWYANGKREYIIANFGTEQNFRAELGPVLSTLYDDLLAQAQRAALEKAAAERTALAEKAAAERAEADRRMAAANTTIEQANAAIAAAQAAKDKAAAAEKAAADQAVVAKRTETEIASPVPSNPVSTGASTFRNSNETARGKKPTSSARHGITGSDAKRHTC